MNGPVLITGACGCIGAWATRLSLDEGDDVVLLDYCGSDHRLRQLLRDEDLSDIRRIDHDIADADGVARYIEKLRPSRIIHLAALQVPMSRADPLLSARVNVVGTVGLFEAVRRAGGLEHPVVYASSVAAYAPDDDPSEPPRKPVTTFYGTTKRHNEATAQVYWLDHGISSIALRPYTVYGVGRDQGVTSAPTLAMLAAAVGRPFTIGFSGASQLQLARDVARTFIAASRSEPRNAAAYNLGGDVAAPADVVAHIERIVPGAAGSIAVTDGPLPFPEHITAQPLPPCLGPDCDTSLETGIAETIEAFGDLHRRGLVDTPALLGGT